MNGVLVIIYGPITIDHSSEIDCVTVTDGLLRHQKTCQSSHLTLSDMELCRTDNPSCKWIYEIQSDACIRRMPNGHFLNQQEKRKSPVLKENIPEKQIPPLELIDMLRYESF